MILKRKVTCSHDTHTFSSNSNSSRISVFQCNKSTTSLTFLNTWYKRWRKKEQIMKILVGLITNIKIAIQFSRGNTPYNCLHETHTYPSYSKFCRFSAFRENGPQWLWPSLIQYKQRRKAAKHENIACFITRHYHAKDDNTIPKRFKWL